MRQAELDSYIKLRRKLLRMSIARCGVENCYFMWSCLSDLKIYTYKILQWYLLSTQFSKPRYKLFGQRQQTLLAVLIIYWARYQLVHFSIAIRLSPKKALCNGMQQSQLFLPCQTSKQQLDLFFLQRYYFLSTKRSTKILKKVVFF